MKSHEYANKLKELADFLLSRPDFDTKTDSLYQSFWFWQAKEPFLAAVRALKPGEKKYGEDTDRDSLLFYPAGLPEGITLELRVQRALFCRKVQEEKWECEPLLSAEEEAQMDAHHESWKAHDIKKRKRGCNGRE
jgi:hypothetical protein